MSAFISEYSNIVLDAEIVRLPYLIRTRRDIRGKWPLARNQDRSCWHRHTSLKLFWPQSVAPWTQKNLIRKMHTHKNQCVVKIIGIISSVFNRNAIISSLLMECSFFLIDPLPSFHKLQNYNSINATVLPLKERRIFPKNLQLYLSQYYFLFLLL